MNHAKETYPEFNWTGALVNFYADGTQYIGKHADDERDLVAGAPILSYSFGAIRTFRIRDKKTNEIKIDVPTHDNCMIAMCGNMQKQFTHEITKLSGKKATELGKRINVTVRCLKP
jgi:alkylated DNA repair dioxygenase AlkB